MADKFFKAASCPDANGRQPLPGEHKYTLAFSLEDGSRLTVEIGDTGLEAFKAMIREMQIDDALEDHSG